MTQKHHNDIQRHYWILLGSKSMVETEAVHMSFDTLLSAIALAKA